MSRQNGCCRCEELEERIFDELRIIKETHVEIRALLQQRAMLLAALERGRRFLKYVHRQAAAALGEHHPRGRWSYFKGAGETARKLWQEMRSS